MVRIRVYPQGWFTGGVRRQRPAALYRMQLHTERQRASMRLQYERALWNQQLRMAQLQGRYGAGMINSSPGVYSPIGRYAPGFIAPPALVSPWMWNTMLNARLGADVFGSGTHFWNSVGALV